LKTAHFGITAQIADDDHLVDGSCHKFLPDSGLGPSMQRFG